MLSKFNDINKFNYRKDKWKSQVESAQNCASQYGTLVVPNVK